MQEITLVLEQLATGKAKPEELLPLVYQQLRELATAKLAHEKPGQTLEPTALVHEAYLRIVDGANHPQFDHRGHFFAAAAEAMRRILVDNARRKKAAKHGGSLQKHEATEQIAAPAPQDDLLAIDEALERFAQIEPQKAELVKLRYFAGLTIEAAAEAMNISPATAKRYWAYSKAWLYQAVSGDKFEES